MIHWPGFITNGWCNDAFVKGLADCQQQGLTQAVGVSNFKLERVKTAQQILKVIPPSPPTLHPYYFHVPCPQPSAASAAAHLTQQYLLHP